MTTYTYDEAFSASLDYFKGDDLAAGVFVSKYALRDNEGRILERTPVDMHKRIAKEFARIEKKKFKKPISFDELFGLLDGFKYLVPQGGPMFGIGNDFQTISLSNCYLATPPDDSYGSILKTDEQLVQISKRRGGVGIDISNLRPNGSPTKNSSRSSTGIIPFMERFSNSIREVGQGNRRGALMVTLSVHHPEVIEFTKIKTDRSKVTGANISLRLTDEFLEAVKADKEYELRFPVDYKETGVKPMISKWVSAKEVWKTIVKNARDHAEPGLLMWDNVLKYGPADCYEEYRSRGTNPCQPAWTYVLTKSGVTELGFIKEGDEIWSESGWTKVVKKWSTGINKVYRYTTTVGSFYGTNDHLLVSNGEKFRAQDCESVDILTGPFYSDLVYDIQDVMDGLVIGDGTYHKASKKLLLCIGENDSDYLKSEVKSLIGDYRPGIQEYGYEVVTTINPTELPYTYQRSIPDRFKLGSAGKVAGFLRGLYSANGSVCGDRITLKTSSFQIVEDVQLMLSSLGIRSYFTTNKSKKVQFSNGVYECKQSYDVNISIDREKFYKNIGFLQSYKNEKVEHLIETKYKSPHATKPLKQTYDIIDVSFISEEETFDITVDNKSHTYWTQGINVSNCSEIPLSPLDSCRLMCINLFSFVKKPFTKDAKFDYNHFFKVAKLTQRLMDDMVDLESEKIEKIISKIHSDPESEDVKSRELEMWKLIKRFNDEGRRTGTGITALGDTIAALGIQYGSEDSIEVTEKIYKTLKLACYESSVEMAEELGPFKCWDPKKEENNPFLLRIKQEDAELYNRMQKFGRRNIALTTTAPTGSVSVLTQTTSGIEPLFQTSYIRRRKVNPHDESVRVDFVDATGDKWQEYKVYHPTLLLWKKSTGETDEKKSPWAGCCAEEIDWVNRVKLQATAQRHVCHAISSTLNLPEDVTVETVDKIYQTAFESGLKGITIYRKNCRTGVLIDKPPKSETNITKTLAPKRPKELKGEIHHFVLNKQKYYVAVGLWENGELYEIFTGVNHDDQGDVVLPKDLKTGFIVKEAKGIYYVVSGDKKWVLTNGHSDDTADALARMISCALRHGSSLSFIIEQLSKTKGPMTSFSKVLARTLKSYIVNGTVSTQDCPECKAKLVFSEGCKQCKNCSWTACS